MRPRDVFGRFDGGLTSRRLQSSIHGELHLSRGNAENASGLVVNQAAVTWAGIAVEWVLNPLEGYFPGRPDLSVGGSEQNHNWNAKRRGQMGWPAVVSNKEAGTAEDPEKFRNGKAAHDKNSLLAVSRHGPQLRFFARAS